MAPRKGFFGRMRDWLRGGDGDYPVQVTPARAGAIEPPTRTEPVGGIEVEMGVELPVHEQPMNVSAVGDVFEFELIPLLRWTSSEMSLDALKERAVVHEAAARGKLLRQASAIARTHEATAPAALEQAVNRELRKGWCFYDMMGLIHCRPSVRVRIDPILRDHLRPYQLEELRLREEHQIAELRAENAEALTEVWLQVIRRLELISELGPVERQFLVPFAAKLSNGVSLAVTMSELKKARRDGINELAAVLRTAVGSHERIGLFEFANAYDKALSGFCRQMGLSPFAWVTSESARIEQSSE